MPILRIHLFGPLCITNGERDFAGCEASSTQELLCYLLLHRAEQHSREGLSAVLWGDSPTSEPKKHLRQTLWHLQRALRARDGSDAGDILTVEGDWIRLATKADLWLDVAEFEQRFALCKGVPGCGLDARGAVALREATSLYRGELLQGWYQDWCLRERERLQDMYLAMLDKLMVHAEMDHNYETSISYGAQILRYNRAHERTHRRLMRLYYLADDRTAALRQYDQCVTALNDELGVHPAKRTVAVYEQIRADCLNVATTRDTVEHLVATVPVSPQDPGRLDDLRHALAGLHDQIGRILGVIEASAPHSD